MGRYVITVFIGCVLGGSVAHADAWEDYVRGGGGMKVLGSSALIHTPWGPPMLHRTTSDTAGCAGKRFDREELILDTRVLGFPGGAHFLLGTALPHGYPVWSYVDPLSWACVEYMGRQVTLQDASFILNGRVKSLAMPTEHDCDVLPATVGMDLGLEVMSPAPDARPGVLEIYFSYGCDDDMVRSAEPIVITDFQVSILGGGQPVDNNPRVVSLEAPSRVCVHPGRTNFVRATVGLSEPVAGRDFQVETFYEGPGAVRRGVEVRRGESEASFNMQLPSDFLGELRLVARSVNPGPGGGLPTGAETWVTLLPATDPACPLGRALQDVARWEPRWDGCWNCRLSVSRLRERLVIHERVVMGTTTRGLNGVAARNVLGTVLTVSENAAGLPTSFLMLGEQVLHELPGIELRGLNTLGMAVGARVDPKAQVRSAIWFDGQTVQELGTLGGVSSDVLAISDDGHLVGWAEDAEGVRRAFISVDGSLKPLPLPTHLESEATSIGGDRWVSGTLVGEKGRQGFLFDLESEEVHLAELPEGGAAIAFHATNAWGKALGSLTTHNQEVVPVLFSAEDGLLRLEALTKVPEGFEPQSADGLADDGSVFLSGLLKGEAAHFRFSP